MQPTLTQVPPKRLRSMIAVLRVAFARRTASGGPACPVPMTIASNCSAMHLSPAFSERRTLRPSSRLSSSAGAPCEPVDALGDVRGCLDRLVNDHALDGID